MRTKRKDLVGQKFTRTAVTEFAGSDANGNHLWKCKCDCGKEHLASSSVLLNGRTKSCGCLRREWLDSGDVKRTHGRSNTKEYNAFWLAKSRCRPDNKNHRDYFDRGIVMCAEWLGKGGFEKFFTHIGPAPSLQHSLDRIDNNRGYEPGNVRWATAQEQVDNRRLKRLEQFSDAAFNIEAEKRGYTKTPIAVVYKATTVSANAPTVGSVVIVDASDS